MDYIDMIGSLRNGVLVVSWLVLQEAPMPKCAIGAWVAAATFASAVAVPSPALAEQNEPIPNFAPDSVTANEKGQ
jgi:hypothetical protein